MTDLIQKAEKFAKKEYLKNSSMHRWDHVSEVMGRALKLAKHFKDVDLESLKLAIIFHDVDYSIPKLHTENSIKVAEKFLKENNHPQEKIDKIKEIMFSHTDHLRRKFGDAKLIEGKIIYDADKTTAMTPKGFTRMIFLRAKTTDLELEEIIKDIKKVCIKFWDNLYLDETRGMIKERYELLKKVFESIEKEIK